MKFLIFVVVLVFGIWLFAFTGITNSGYSPFVSRWVEISCSPQGKTCLKILKERTFGVDYTTTTTIVWEKYFFWFSSLPANFLVFDPEVKVDIIWLSENSVMFNYGGGEYKLIGAKPSRDGFRI
ncbi:hypothetical protein [Polycladidibacter stylochi]|uniref:hypothetical protein n=1 Tax=Polycladidibacter stylochi TaxID=1807766 RepID=UPI0008332FFB|nr:hypothetical protein [Pseudovibrio stylochi]